MTSIIVLTLAQLFLYKSLSETQQELLTQNADLLNIALIYSITLWETSFIQSQSF